MSQAQAKSAEHAVTCPDLTLLMTGAFYHPEAGVRSGLQEDLETWIQSLAPIHESKAVEKVIRECQGTPLEPFWLEPEDIACAVALVRIAFSQKSKANRFRITSRDTIGDGGGFIMTRALQSYFAERYAGAKNPQRHHRSGYFIPGLLPPAGFPGVSARATLEIDEEGMQVRIPRLDPVAEQVAGRLPDSGWDSLVHDLA
ncbi:MAG TPA: hypothetical protein DDW68_08720, partial [Verrucomicrobiales bacterium]|nr:hypothetical protein [Verrucomicrobiales bacterium]